MKKGKTNNRQKKVYIIRQSSKGEIGLKAERVKDPTFAT